MKNSKAEIYTSEVAVVLIGHFNPIVFQPEWFANQKLLRSAEMEKANVNIIHPDVVSFSNDWLSLQVTRDRFTALTNSEPHQSHLLDFVTGTFTKLQHSPISQLGLNCTRAIQFEQDSDWHNFGHYFAPKSPWGGLIKSPGMLQVRIKASRDDEWSGDINWSVEYAGYLKANFKVNDHYELANENKITESASYFTSLLQAEFKPSIERAVKVSDAIFNQFSATEKFDDGLDSTDI